MLKLQAKLAADAKAKADADAQANCCETKAKQMLKLKPKLMPMLKRNLLLMLKQKLMLMLQAKLAADAKAKADAARQNKIKLKLLLLLNLAIDALAKAKADAMPKDEYGKSMDNLTKTLEDSKKKQQQLLTRLDASVANKEKALKELREENDLSDKGIVKTTVEFKSTSGENAELESIRAQIAEVNKAQDE